MNKLPLLLLLVVGSAVRSAEPHWHSIPAHERWITAVAFSPDDRWVATSSDDQRLKCWDSRSGQLRWQVRVDSPLTAIAWSSDGKNLHCGSWNGAWQQRQSTTGEMIGSQPAHRENITRLAISPNGVLLATASGDDHCRLWEVATLKCLLTIEQDNEYDATCVAFSPDSKYFVVGDGENGLKLYRVVDGELLLTFAGHSETVSAVAFTPDGKRVISGSWDDTLRVWDAATGAELQTLRSHTDDITDLALSPSGDRIYSGSADRSLRAWDVATGKHIAAQENLPAAISALAISANGRRLAIGCKETLLLWETPP
jgi:WD40 repeat protein